MFVAIAVLVIVAAAIAASAIHRFIDSFVLATILQLILLAAVVAILERMLSRFSFFLIALIVDAGAPVALVLLKKTLPQRFDAAGQRNRGASEDSSSI
jgi:O-antigen ligase